MATKSMLKTYRKRVKSSSCRGLRGRTCAKRPGCKSARGTKRSFCRTKKNATRRRSMRIKRR